MQTPELILPYLWTYWFFMLALLRFETCQSYLRKFCSVAQATFLFPILLASLTQGHGRGQARSRLLMSTPLNVLIHVLLDTFY
jgi:hypothetical protein